MAKATIAQLQALGFSDKQFGAPADWAATGGYLDTLLGEVATFVADQVGSGYAAVVSGVQFYHLQQAELAFVEADLWRRVERHERANGTIARRKDGGEAVGSRPLANADKAEARAWYHLGQVTLKHYGSPLSVSAVESGPFDVVGS
jgi:hypothetical protein